jgi:hypothetical protein
MPRVPAASHQLYWPDMAFRITSCAFTIRSISAAEICCSHQLLLATPGVLAWFREKYGIGDDITARLKIGFAASRGKARLS